jgi:peptidoglycan endopeptidase LytE
MTENKIELNAEELEEVSGGRDAYGGYAKKPRAKAGCKVYQIKSGETLGGIARRHGTTVERIMAVNPELSNPNRIMAKYWIYIPA